MHKDFWRCSRIHCPILQTNVAITFLNIIHEMIDIIMIDVMIMLFGYIAFVHSQSGARYYAALTKNANNL